MGGSRQKDLTRGRVLDRYEASLARTLERGPGRPGSHPPAMDMWAMALGVEMDKSKSTERARRKVELEEAGKRMDVWASPVPPITHQPQLLPRRRKRGREALGGAARGQAGAFVPDVTALDGFVSDLQLRLFSVEGSAVTKNLRTDVPRPSRSVRGGSDTGRRGYERQTPVPAPGGPHAAFVASTDVYGIPEAFIANAEEARRRWETHHANLERRDEEFLLRYKRSARMSVVQVSIAKAWRGFVFRRRFLAWKGRRQWAVKRHIRAWCVAVRAERLYSGNLKRSVFTHWNDIVEEERNTRVMGQLSFQAAVSSIRLSRQAVVQFFQDLAPSATYSTPEVLRNKASVKRRIMKARILFQGWRDAASLKQKAAAQAAFKMSKAVRLHTASAILWSPEIVSLLFQVWSRMVLFKKAVREERETPTFLPEAGYRSLPEWDMWVASKGRHLALKRRVMHTGSQIFIRNKFRRWVWFAKWSLSQEERVIEASQQHYDANKMTQAFAAWASVCRDRGSMLRRITKCWQGWSTFASRKKKTKLLKEKAMEHLRLLRTGSVMSDILAYARDRKATAFTVSKLVITTKGFGGMALSCVATGRTTQLYALLAWQALKKYTFKRRRWKWLLYEHSKTEAFHAKQAVFKAWSYATGRRHRPDAASLTLTAALPFSTWDRLARNYVDQGVIPVEQLRKDMVGQSIMQINTAWWLLNEPSVEKGNRDSNSTGAAALNGLGAVQGSPRRGEGRKELAQSGSGGGGARGRMLLPGGSKDKGITSDWRTLAPALFAAVDDCDTAVVIDLLHQGAQVNCVYVPPENAPAGRSGTSKNVSSRNNQDEEGSVAGGHGVGAGRALDLPSPALVARPDGTFEMRGTTPLHAAAGHFSADFTPIVVALLHAGAFVGALDGTGRTPLQVCTSPQTAALLHTHASRLERHMFSPQEVRWGQQVLTSERSSVGAAGLWRYIVRAALVARLDKLSAALRREDARAEKSTADAARTSQAQGVSGLFTGEKGSTAGDGFSPVAPVGMDEREKELIRMKMERLDAAKTIIDREHALHGGTAGTPGGSSGVGGAGGGSIGISPINDHAKSRERTGKERTTADHRRAFSAKRAQAAAWFRSFQQDLAKAGMLPPRGGPPTDKSSPSTPAPGNGDAATAKRVLDIVRGARGGENRGEGPGSGGGGRGAIAGGRLNSTAFGGGARGGMLGRGGNTSGTDAFNITEVLDCYVALDAVLKERKRVMDERGARDDGLIERGDWVGLRRAMEASKHQDDPASPSAKRRKKGRKNRPASSSTLPTTTGDSPTHLDRSFSPALPGIHLHDGVRADHAVSVEAAVTVPGGAAGGIQDETVVSGELSIDVIPTSSSKRCHSSNVALRGTVDSEVMARAHRTISAWKSGGEASGSSFGHGRPAENQSFGRGMLSRVPPGWWGRGGERVLVLMLDERRRLREKGSTAGSAKLARPSAMLPWRQKKARHGFERTWKGETRWQEAIKQAQGKIRTIVRKQVNIAAQSKEAVEEITPQTLRRDIDLKASLIVSLKAKEQQCLRTIESVKGQLEEGRVFLMRIQSILTKYASYNMGKMDTLENEFRELSRQQQTTRARRNVLGTGVKKGRKRHPKRSKAGSSTKGPASTGSPPGVANDRGTRRPTTTPPAVEGVLPSTSPAPWATEGAGASAQQTPPPSTTPPASKTPKGARRRQGSPSSRRQATAGSGKRKRKQPANKKKAKNLSPRDSGNVEGQPAGRSATRATADKAGTSAVAEAVGQRERGQDRVDDDEGVLETQSASSRVVALGLTVRERQEELRDAKEARDLAEEEECRRACRTGHEKTGEKTRVLVTENTPTAVDLSKEETVRMLATQYEQALKQTFEPERRAAVASRIAQVEAEQREKERKAGTADAETPEKRKPEIAPSDGGVPDIAGLMPSAEMPGQIGHLLDDPGLGLTRQELDTLFDLVDDQGGRITDTGRQQSTQATRDVNRGLLLFLRRRGLRRTDIVPVEKDLSHRNPLRRNRAHYLKKQNYPTTSASTSLAANTRIPKQASQPSLSDVNTTTQESVWRGSSSALGTQPRSRPASTHSRQPARGDVSRNTLETGDVTYGTEHDGGEGGSAEARLYPRTLGSSVSVLDEKDAVVRTGGTRFAGEDPIRGRLRATDPFLWMGRLHAGATAISGLIDQADGALAGLDDGSSDVESTASSGRGGNRRRTDRNDQVSRGQDGVTGPASRGSAQASWSVQTAEGVGDTKEYDGHGSDRDEGGTSAAEAGEEHWSSSESGAVDLMSSTMTSYSQAVETNRIMAGGMLMEMEEESGESGSDDPPDDTSAIERDSRRLEEPRKRPGIGSGPCPMRSPLNARSAALGSSAKLRTIEAGRNGVTKALVAEADSVDITSPIVEDTDGHHLPCDVTQASVSTGPGDWAEDESQDICFDDIVSGINRDVASRAPPSPRHSTEAVSVSHHHAMRPPWSAQERASPTRQKRDGLSSQRSPGKDRRPRSTPAGFRARAEAASTVLDRRPPWSLPLDSVFAPRVKGAMQPNITLVSPGRGRNAVGSPAGSDLEDRQHQQKNPRRTRSLVVLGASALHRQRQRTNAPSGVSAGIVPPRLPRSASSCAVGAGRGRDGDARNEDFETREDQNPSADERSASIRRCHSASEALLHSSLLHEAPRVDEAPAMTDGIWSWGWHEDGSSPDNLMSTASKNAASSVATPERCKNARGLGIRSTASQRKKRRGRSDSREETPMGTRALPPQRSRGKYPSRRRSNGDGGSATLPSRGPGASSRPWTTGEFEGNDGSDERSAVSTSAAKFWREGGVLLRQTRSADGLLLNSSEANTHPPSTKADNSAEEAFFSTAGELECAGDDEEGFLGLDDFDIQKNSGEEPGATGQTGVLDAIDGDAADGGDALDEEAIEFPGDLIKNLARRVSFADELAVNRPADGSLDSGERRSSRVVETEGWGAQRRRMSSLIGSSNGYLEGNGSIGGHFLGRDGRRKSDLERCQKAMEIARAAHELLFNDTRPDGLRPITGSPMSDGRDAQGSGGLFVGLAGLKGFDLSFLGALSTDQGGGAKGSSSASSRLAANKRLSTNSRMAAGFLLDRKPGSLLANPPRSPGCVPSPGKSQAPPETSGAANAVAQDEEERQMVRNGFSPERVRDNSESMKSAPGAGLPHSEASAAGEPPSMENSCASPAGDELRRSAAPSTDDTRHGPDIPEGFGIDERESDAPRALRGSADRDKAQSGEGKGRRGSGARVMIGMAASSSAAAAAGSIFAPKAAVLWSARDLGVDELVSSIASGKKKPSRPGSSKYISRALLAAYRQATPVFEVEASSWRKHEGAVAGVDYPSRPPSEWGWGGSDVGRATREAITAVADEAKQGAWKNFEQRPISRAEARALQELRISRSIPGRTRPRETGTFVSLCSSENSTATSLETEDHASLTSSIIAQGSETRERIASTTPPPHGDQAKSSKRAKSTIDERQDPSTANGSPARDDARYAGSEFSTAPMPTRGGAMHSVEPRLDVERDRGGKCLSPGTAGRDCKGGESSPNWGTISPTGEAPSVAPSSGYGLGAGFGAAGESAFRLSGEADADDVVRAMVRLSSASPGTGIGADEEGTRYNARHQRGNVSVSSREVRAHGRTASRSRDSNTAQAEAGSRLLSSADRSSGGICRGSTPAIRSRRFGRAQPPVRKQDGCPPAVGDKTLDIEGRPLQSEEGPHKAGRGLSRSRRRVAPPTCGLPVSSSEPDQAGRSSAAPQGRSRSRRDKPVAERPGRKGTFLPESRSAPSMVSQQEREWPLASPLRGDSAGCAGGAGDGSARGVVSEESLMQTHSSSALALNSVSSRSYAVSLASGASQQLRPLASIDTSLGGDGFESNEPTISHLRRSNSDGNRRRSSSTPVSATAGGSLSSSFWQDQQQPLQTRPITEQGQSRVPAIGDSGSGRIEPQEKSTTGEQMSVIIEGVTRDAAMSVFSSGGRERPLSPIKSTADTVAAFTAGPHVDVRTPQVPSTCTTDTQPSAGCSADESMSGSGRAGQKFKSKGKSIGSGHSVTGESAVKARSSTAEPGARGTAREEGDSLRFDGKEEASSIAAGHSPVALSSASRQSSSKAGGSKVYSAKPHKGGSVRAREATIDSDASVAPKSSQNTTTSELLHHTSPSPCVVLEEDCDDLSSAELVKGSENQPKSFGETGNGLPRTTKSIESRTTKPGESSRGQAEGTRVGLDKTRGDTRRSSREAGFFRSGNGGRTIASDGSSLNSHGSSISSGSGAPSNTHARRNRSSQKAHHQVGDEARGSTTRGGVRAKKGSAPGEANASVTETSPLAVAELEGATGASHDAQQDDIHHRPSRNSKEAHGGAASKKSENDEVRPLPRASGAAVASGGRAKTSGGTAGKSPQSAIKVRTRPARVEDRDLHTTTEALTRHHLAVGGLLKVEYDELLDGSDGEDDAVGRRVRTRKEPLMIPQGSRQNGMAYWRAKEEKERLRQRRPRSATDNLATEANTGNRAGNGRDVHAGGAESGGPLAGANPQWEDEKEEIKRLLTAARARREAAVARVRAQREQAIIDSETDSLGQAAAGDTSTPPASEQGSRSLLPRVDSGPALASATAVRAGPGPANEKESAVSLPAVAGAAQNDEGGEVGQGRSEQIKGRAPPWKGFTLGDDGEAMLRRRRAPSPDRVSPVEGREDWEYQLIVPGMKDNLVNFSVDTAAVRANFGKLRRGVEIRNRMGLDDTDADLHDESSDEVEATESADGNDVPDDYKSTPATPQERRSNASFACDNKPPGTRESIFSSEASGTAGGIPDIPIRRRTRVAGAQGGVTSGSTTVPSAGVHQVGTIAQASRIIPELELEHGSMVFPLDSLRGDADFDDDDEDT
ncbi:unnamed protein product [Scytosiphon promiscuus]